MGRRQPRRVGGDRSVRGGDAGREVSRDRQRAVPRAAGGADDGVVRAAVAVRAGRALGRRHAHPDDGGRLRGGSWRRRRRWCARPTRRCASARRRRRSTTARPTRSMPSATSTRGGGAAAATAGTRACSSDAGDAFDFFVLHPYDFTVDDDARVRLAERARKTVRDLRAAAPDKRRRHHRVRLPLRRRHAAQRHRHRRHDAHGDRGAAAGLRAPHPHRDRRDRAVRRLGRDRPGAGEEGGLAWPRELVRRLQPVALPTASTRRRAPRRHDGTLVALPTRDDASRHLAVLLRRPPHRRRARDRDVRLTLPAGTLRRAHLDAVGGDAGGDRRHRRRRRSGAAPTAASTSRFRAHSVVVLSADAQ